MLLNIGCGAVAHPDWLDLDMVPRHPLAVTCDLRHGLSLAANAADACCSAPVLDRRTTAEADFYLSAANLVGAVRAVQTRPAWATRLQRPRQRRAARRLGIIGGADRRLALATGRFRHSGEVHRVMRDEHAVALLLQRHGFADIRVVGPRESRLPGFASVALDAPAEAAPPRKPDSLYAEAIKAAA